MIEDYSDDPEYLIWLKEQSEGDINEILYEYFLYWKDQDDDDTELMELTPAEQKKMQNLIAIKFHAESVLFDIDRGVAKLGYDILKANYPNMINDNIKRTAKLRGFK
jgi:hypothetical protein